MPHKSCACPSRASAGWSPPWSARSAGSCSSGPAAASRSPRSASSSMPCCCPDTRRCRPRSPAPATQPGRRPGCCASGAWSHCRPALTRLIDQFSVRCPDCQVSLHVVETRNPYASLRSGDIDVLVSFLVVNQPDLTTGPVIERRDRVLLVAAGTGSRVPGQCRWRTSVTRKSTRTRRTFQRRYTTRSCHRSPRPAGLSATSPRKDDEDVITAGARGQIVHPGRQANRRPPAQTSCSSQSATCRLCLSGSSGGPCTKTPASALLPPPPAPSTDQAPEPLLPPADAGNLRHNAETRSGHSRTICAPSIT